MDHARAADSQLGRSSAGVSGISEFYGRAGRTSSGKEDWATGKDSAICDAHRSHETPGRESDHRVSEIIDKLRPPKKKNREEKEALQLKNLRLRTASEGRPYKCEEEKPKAHAQKRRAEHPVLVIVGILGDAGGCDPRARSGKSVAVHAGDADKDDGAKAGRKHLQLGVNFGVSIAGERNCSACCGDHVRARGRWRPLQSRGRPYPRLAGSGRECRRADGLRRRELRMHASPPRELRRSVRRLE